MEIWLNSNLVAVDSGSSLADLIKSQGYDDSRVAVEIDMQIIPKAIWSEFKLKNEMKIEIVEFVGGG